MSQSRLRTLGPSSAWAVALTATLGCDEPLPCVYAPDMTASEADMATPGAPQLTTFSCRCTDQFGVPIAGATVALGGKSTTTAADGSFTLTDVPVAARVITVDATAVAPPEEMGEVNLSRIAIGEVGAAGERRYGMIAEEVILQPGITMGREQAFVVPLSARLQDLGESLGEGDVLSEQVVITGDNDGSNYDPAIQAARLVLEKGTKITFPPGVDKALSITRVPPALMPGSLAAGAGSSMAVMIQPIGATFSPPARLILPTNFDVPYGQKQDFQELSFETGRYVGIGPGTVSGGGEGYQEVHPDLGVRVARAGFHLTLCPEVAVQGIVRRGETPVAGARVEARTTDSVEENYFQTYALPRATTLTGPDGRYRLSGLRACAVRLLATTESAQGQLSLSGGNTLINEGRDLSQDLLLPTESLRRFNLRVRLKRPGEPAVPFPSVGIYTADCLAGECYGETNSLGEVLFRDVAGTPGATVQVELCGNRGSTLTRQVQVPAQTPSPPACGLFQAADVVELNITTNCGSGSGSG